MHVEGVLLEAGDPGGEPFLLVFDSVGDHCLPLYTPRVQLPPSKMAALNRNWEFGIGETDEALPFRTIHSDTRTRDPMSSQPFCLETFEKNKKFTFSSVF